MDIEQRALTLQRGVLAALVVVVPLAFLRGTLDGFQLPSLFVVAAGVALLAAAALARAVATGRAGVAASPVIPAIGIFTVAVVCVSVLAPHPGLAWFGVADRWTGGFAYLLYAALAVLAAGALDRGSVTSLVWPFVLAAGLVSLIAITQWLEVGPFAWSRQLAGVSSTLGNPNFAAAHLGISAPFAVYALIRGGTVARRAAAGVVLVLMVVAIWRTQTLQGPLTALIGCAGLLVAWLLGRSRRIALAATSAMLLAPVAAVAVIVPCGYAPRVIAEGNLDLRGWYWTAAGRMFASNPVAGVGMDHYEVYYRDFAPVDVALRLGAQAIADQPHSVPLAMLASGGLILGLAYLAVILTSARALLQAWTSADEGHRLLVGTVGGAWLAYHAQAMISIDVPTLAFLHWLLIGMLVALAQPGRWTADLPWSAARRGRKGASQRRAAIGVAAVVALAGMTIAWLPVRADRAMGRGLTEASVDDARAAFDQALAIRPAEARYYFRAGGHMADLGDFEAARHYFEAGAHRAPWNLEPIVSAARTARVLGDAEAALAWYDHALAVERIDADLHIEAAQVAIEAGEHEQADTWLHRVLDRQPDHDEAQALLQSMPALSD